MRRENGELLTGISDPCSPRRIYYSELNGNLIVTFAGVGGHSITIEGWKNGELGINLKQLSPNCGPGPGAPDPFASPIVLDLDGDGLELTNGQTTAVYFDIDDDGLRELTNWVMPDDGLLAFDANGNGVIDGARELFGYGTSNSIGQSVRRFTAAIYGFNDFEMQTYTSGYEKLALFDFNEDSIISAADGTSFIALRIWRDLNQDGRSSADELFSLTDVSVQSISLTVDHVLTRVDDNLISDIGTFTTTTGLVQTAADVWFRFEGQDTRYDVDWDVPTAKKAMPNILGVGNVYDVCTNFVQPMN